MIFMNPKICFINIKSDCFSILKDINFDSFSKYNEAKKVFKVRTP